MAGSERNETQCSTAHRAVATGTRQDWTAHRDLSTDFKMTREFAGRPLRLGRLFGTSPLYFVTFYTHGRRACLARDEVHAAFVLFYPASGTQVRYCGWSPCDHAGPCPSVCPWQPEFSFERMGWNAETIVGQSESLVEKGRVDLAGRIFRSCVTKQ